MRYVLRNAASRDARQLLTAREDLPCRPSAELVIIPRVRTDLIVHGQPRIKVLVKRDLRGCLVRTLINGYLLRLLERMSLPLRAESPLALYAFVVTVHRNVLRSP